MWGFITVRYLHLPLICKHYNIHVLYIHVWSNHGPWGYGATTIDIQSILYVGNYKNKLFQEQRSQSKHSAAFSIKSRKNLTRKFQNATIFIRKLWIASGVLQTTQGKCEGNKTLSVVIFCSFYPNVVFIYIYKCVHAGRIITIFEK